MNIKTRYLVNLFVLSLIDVIIPVPILGIILIYVVLQRPPWFRQAVQDLYHE
jgi:hypothetical protein